MKCILIDDEQMALDTMINYLSKIREVEVLGMFDNALDAMPLINSGKVDVVFCDIQMPDINGISYFKSLKNPPVFIFVTADPNRAIESYELGVLDYIQKPFGVDRLLKSVNRAKAFLESEKLPSDERKFLIIKDRSSNVIVPYNEVFFIKSDKDYVTIATLEKNYTVWRKISALEKTLSSAKQFIRVQKSYIVNLDFAKTIEGGHIKMKGDIENIPIGRQYKDALYEHLGINGDN